MGRRGVSSSEKRNLCPLLTSNQRDRAPGRALELDLDYWSGNVPCWLISSLGYGPGWIQGRGLLKARVRARS